MRELLDTPDSAPDRPIPQRVRAAWERLPETTRKWLAAPDEARLDADQAWLARDGNHLIPYGSTAYPKLLATLADPPLALFVTGDPAVLTLPQIGMVGSRNPTPQGIRAAEDFAAHLAAAGLVVTSGLAIGIDGAAHRGALRGGRTIAVTGTGLDRVYPARHRDLAREIVASAGALVSEFPPGTPARAGHFPRRNRIISGLSLGVLVVEATIKSGSLITARHAAEQGREVFAMPGSIQNPAARGCHQLIRQGAKLAETGQHVIEELGSLLAGLEAGTEAPSPTSAEASDMMPELDEEYRLLLRNMGHDPISVDELVSRSGLPAESISSMLLMLELQGRVTAAAGGRYCRTTSEVV